MNYLSPKPLVVHFPHFLTGYPGQDAGGVDRCRWTLLTPRVVVSNSNQQPTTAFFFGPLSTRNCQPKVEFFWTQHTGCPGLLDGPDSPTQPGSNLRFASEDFLLLQLRGGLLALRIGEKITSQAVQRNQVAHCYARNVGRFFRLEFEKCDVKQLRFETYYLVWSFNLELIKCSFGLGNLYCFFELTKCFKHVNRIKKCPRKAFKHLKNKWTPSASIGCTG